MLKSVVYAFAEHAADEIADDVLEAFAFFIAFLVAFGVFRILLFLRLWSSVGGSGGSIVIHVGEDVDFACRLLATWRGTLLVVGLLSLLGFLDAVEHEADACGVHGMSEFGEGHAVVCRWL